MMKTIWTMKKGGCVLVLSLLVLMMVAPNASAQTKGKKSSPADTMATASKTKKKSLLKPKSKSEKKKTSVTSKTETKKKSSKDKSLKTEKKTTAKKKMEVEKKSTTSKKATKKVNRGEPTRGTVKRDSTYVPIPQRSHQQP